MTHINEGQFVWCVRKKGFRAHIVGPTGRTYCKAENAGVRLDMMQSEAPKGRKICRNCTRIRDEKKPNFEITPIGEFTSSAGGTVGVVLSGTWIFVKGRGRLYFPPGDAEALVSLIQTASIVSGRLETPHPERSAG